MFLIYKDQITKTACDLASFRVTQQTMLAFVAKHFDQQTCRGKRVRHGDSNKKQQRQRRRRS